MKEYFKNSSNLDIKYSLNTKVEGSVNIMNIHNMLKKCMAVVKNCKETTEKRLIGLSEVLDYVCNMVQPDSYCISLIKMIIDELENYSIDSKVLIALCGELESKLGIKEADYTITVVVSEENQIYDVVAMNQSC